MPDSTLPTAERTGVVARIVRVFKAERLAIRRPLIGPDARSIARRFGLQAEEHRFKGRRYFRLLDGDDAVATFSVDGQCEWVNAKIPPPRHPPVDSPEFAAGLARSADLINELAAELRQRHARASRLAPLAQPLAVRRTCARARGRRARPSRRAAASAAGGRRAGPDSDPGDSEPHASTAVSVVDRRAFGPRSSRRVPAVSRGPSGTSSVDPIVATTLGDYGPLDPGPLGPLDPSLPRRIELAGALPALERRFGSDAEGSFACPLPGHTGTARLGVPDEDPAGDLRVLCCRGRWRSLGEVRAAHAYGEDRIRSNIELAVWLRRLLFEADLFEPVAVDLPLLPPGASETAERVRDGFALLVGLRWADYEPRPVAFALRFVTAWCGLSSFRAAREAVTALVDAGVIREAGAAGRVRLFLPGEVRHADVSGDKGPPNPPSGPGGGDDTWDEGDLIGKLVEAFDAVEVIEGEPPCGYPRHRQQYVRAAAGGPVRCPRCERLDDVAYVPVEIEARR